MPQAVPPIYNQQQQSHTANPQTLQYNHNANVADTQLVSQPQGNMSSAIPQTAAQQILMSPADRWGLLGLLAMIKSTDIDQNLLSIGTDLGTMGLDMQHQGYDHHLRYLIDVQSRRF